MNARPALKCGKCGEGIDTCGFCDEPDCRSPICSHCIAIELKERPAEPLAYGG